MAAPIDQDTATSEPELTLRGLILGGRDHTLKVGVDMKPVGEV